MKRPPLLNLNPRNVFVAVLFAVIFGFAIAWVSIPARAGLGAVAAGSAAALSSPQAIVVARSAVVDPMKLPPPAVGMHRHSRPLRMRDPVAYRKRKAAMASGAILPEVPSVLSLPLATVPTVLTNFVGLAALESCDLCEPPDTQVAAGPSHVFEVDNVAGKIFDKSGSVVMATFGLNGLFGLNATLFTSDPRIEYDTISDRWFISMLSMNTSNPATATTGEFDLAVSTSSDPTKPFNIYAFATAGSFPDQPSLGFNDDKVASSGNSFSCNPNCETGPPESNELVVWNKSELVAGDATVHTDFLKPGDLTDLPIIPAKSRSSTSTLFMASFPDNTNSMTIWSLTGVPGVDGGTNPATTDVTINSLNDPPNATQKGSTHTIDTGDARLLDAVYRDGKFWTSATSACTPPSDTAQRSCLRFIEILTATLSVNQDFDFGINKFYNYYPSVDLDSSDNLITSFSQSTRAFSQASNNEFPSAFLAARLDSDPINTLGTPVLFKPGVATYSSLHPDSVNGSLRWGDYSGACVDPADESVIWLAAEYSAAATSNQNWGTWIAKARVGPAPSPTPTATATPTATPTATTTATATPSVTATATASATATVSATATPSASATATVSPTATPSVTATVTPTATATPTNTATATATATVTPTATTTPTATPTPPFGRLSLSTNHLAFGKVKVNSMKSLPFKVRNSGNFNLRVTIGTLVAPFAVNGSGTFDIPKGQSRPAAVVFQPLATGAASQTLNVTSDDPNHPLKGVHVHGVGK